MSNRVWNGTITPEQIKQAKYLRSTGRRGKRCWRVIANMLNVPEHRIRMELDPNYIGRKSKRYESKQYNPKKFGFGNHVHIPDEVLEERERRLNAMPQSLSAMLFGDPPRGYSALDKR